MNKYVKNFLLILIIATCGGIIGELIRKDDSSSKDEIEVLNRINDSLLKKNDSLYISIKGHELRLRLSDELITKQEERQQQMETRLGGLNKKYKNLKSEYEKALHHADGFGSDEIRRYFADSLR